MNDRPLFIVSCGRSGTTLLRWMLNCHPNIAIPPESYFIVEIYDRFFTTYDKTNRTVREQVIRYLFDHPFYKEFHLDNGSVYRSLVAPEELQLSELISIVYQTYAQQYGKVRWGDKTPHYVSRMDAIRQLFPDAQFIHVIRDGRDVALSILKVDFGPNSLPESALDWKHWVQTGRKLGKEIGNKHYLEIFYENLVRAPERSLRTVCEFIGESFHEEMLYHHRHKDLAFHESHQLLPQPVTTSRIGKWRQQMREDEVKLFESIAGGLLQELGYDTLTTWPAFNEGMSELLRWLRRAKSNPRSMAGSLKRRLKGFLQSGQVSP